VWAGTYVYACLPSLGKNNTMMMIRTRDEGSPGFKHAQAIPPILAPPALSPLERSSKRLTGRRTRTSTDSCVVEAGGGG